VKRAAVFGFLFVLFAAASFGADAPAITGPDAGQFAPDYRLQDQKGDWHTLVQELGVDVDDITQVLLAGSFGSYLSASSAVRIGLVPKLALPRIVSAGNVAGEGAKMAALSLRERAAAEAILDEVEYVELSGRTDFQDVFIDQLAFPG